MSPVDAGVEIDAIGPERIEEESPGPRWCVLGRLEKTAIGKREAGGVTRVRRREPAGCLLYGPYWQLPSGSYRLSLRCRSSRPRMPSQPVLGVEVIAMNRVQLAWLDLTGGELQAETASLDFSVSPTLGLGAGDEARLEFRFFHLGNADLTISAVDLLSLQTSGAPPEPVRRWRMLGRLQTTAIGRRRGDVITVPRTARPGCMLDGGRPFLQLPRGQYRLSFRCNAGSPLFASEPILGVEVIARRRWRDGHFWNWSLLPGLSATGGTQLAWADFTASQLRAGLGAIDFTVPLELSLESRQEVVCEFRFVHLGNADLTITAVDLQLMGQQEAVPSLPREWRLLGRLVKGRIGAHHADCVTVRHTEPPDILLNGGRPELHLPEGRYRLSFCCRAGSPQRKSEVALAVEVVARTRALGSLSHTLSRLHGREWMAAWHSLLRPRSLIQQRRNFTSEELQTGSVSLDFEVPAKLSLEGGQNVGFEFKFSYLGNADLAISKIKLCETVIGEALSGKHLRSSGKPEKINVVIVGNCQAQTIYEALVRTSELSARLDAKYHFVGLQKDLHYLGKAELETCDALLVQDIRDWENYPLRPNIREDTRIIKFPLLHFASLWPFDHYNGPGDKVAYEREWPNLTFLYQDGLLARLRKEIADPEQRLEAYRALSVDGIINYVKLHDFEKRRLLAIDRQFGVRIGHYILDNFQRVSLFYTTNHPNGRIIAMLMQYLLESLDIDEIYRPIRSLDHLNRLQVPVHPKVAQALGVKWADDATKYLYCGERITWETYVRRYIEHYG